jgi:hypothetical protein
VHRRAIAGGNYVFNLTQPASFLVRDELSYFLNQNNSSEFTGSYDQLYEDNFGSVSEEERGRNALNDGGPEMQSFPGLSP